VPPSGRNSPATHQPLTDAERARGINQLLLDGISPTKVAKGPSTTKEAVAAARVAIDSEKAMSARRPDNSAWWRPPRFVEFDGDDESQTELIKVAGTDQFGHRVAQLRAGREAWTSPCALAGTPGLFMSDGAVVELPCRPTPEDVVTSFSRSLIDAARHRKEFSAVSPRSGNAPSANVSALPRPAPQPTGSSTRTSRSRSWCSSRVFSGLSQSATWIPSTLRSPTHWP
jgi:hypothetical protein